MAVLVTGGAGYVGSHIVIELLKHNDEVVIVDNLSNSFLETIKAVEDISGKTVSFYPDDLRDREALEQIFKKHEINAVIHLAAVKSVSDSIRSPLEYYENNVVGTLNLLDVMKRHHVKNLIFSSSATVYGESSEVPVTETTPRGKITSPYGKTKVMVEEILKDLYESDRTFNITILRYFNPIGVHHSGKIGENPRQQMKNLIPQILETISGNRTSLCVFGNHYDTPDGTGIRDYIHVEDLARGHLLALKKQKSRPGLNIYNLGTGKGYSVLEVIHAFEEFLEEPIPYQIVSPRAGDIGISYCDTKKAEQELGFRAEKNLRQMCHDILNWYWQR